MHGRAARRRRPVRLEHVRPPHAARHPPVLRGARHRRSWPTARSPSACSPARSPRTWTSAAPTGASRQGQHGRDQDVRRAVRRGDVPAQRARGRRAEGHRRRATARACRSSRCAGRSRTRRSAPRWSAAAPSPRSRTTSARRLVDLPTPTSPRSTRSSPATASTPSPTTGSRTPERPEGSTELAGKVADRHRRRRRARPGDGRAASSTRAREVVIADIDAERGEALASELGDAVAFQQTDVADADAGPGGGRLRGRALRRAARHVQQRRIGGSPTPLPRRRPDRLRPRDGA